MSDEKKPTKHEEPYFKSVPTTLHDDFSVENWPILCRLLMPIYDPDTGSLMRQEGVLRITPQGVVWRVSIECPTEKKVCTVEVVSLEELFTHLELLLSDHRVSWSDNWKKRKSDLTRLDR
jgi:hypothetical protein